MSDTARPARRRNGAIISLLIYAAIGLGFGLLAATTADADPSPFNTLSCACEQGAPANSTTSHEEIARGIRQGELGWPAPTTPD